MLVLTYGVDNYSSEEVLNRVDECGLSEKGSRTAVALLILACILQVRDIGWFCQQRSCAYALSILHYS
jgi:hypothetical protein